MRLGEYPFEPLKGTNLQNNDRVRIVKSGDTVSSVYKY